MKSFFQNLRRKLEQKPVRNIGLAAGVLALAAAIAVISSGNGGNGEPEAAAKRAVELVNVSDFQSGALGLTAPSADGVSFVVRAESNGRVNRVARTGIVAQGAVLAEIDNAAQRAALLQAQGMYEATLAAAEISNVSAADAATNLVSAKQNAINADRAAFAAFNSVIVNTVDELFADPHSSNHPGVRIGADGRAIEIGRERIALGRAISEWQTGTNALSAEQNSAALGAALDQSIARIDRLSAMVNTFLNLLSRHRPDEVFTESELARLGERFSAAQAALNGQRSALENAKVAVQRAEDAVRTAQIGGTGGQVSAANAQIKQALGSYQAAQAAYNKTIVRAPFAGRVTAFNVAVGDIISYGASVAIIVPDDGVETESSFDLPLSAVKYTPDGALVFVVNGEGAIEAVPVSTGLVTAGAIKVTGLAGDERIVKDVRGLKAGDEVETANE